MVHTRLNEHEPNPNPHVNFITPLPAQSTQQEDARQLLRALAAQVRPLMKAHGFSVNSLEEYEHNRVFAGRNWNKGETVELVLRRSNGSFLPTSLLMSTLCHELAHIKHMNHGPAFQTLWKQLRDDVYNLQNQGYYGDGYWSSGIRLADSSRITGQGIEAGDFPEYMCGGAQPRTRPTALRRQRPNTIMPSNKTGRQTAKKRKAGTRVTGKGVFSGEGVVLLEDTSADSKGKGFGKRAGSKRAREERALAAERRMRASTSTSTPQTHDTSTYAVQDPLMEDADPNPDSSECIIPETDADRRRALLLSETKNDVDALKLKGPGMGNAWWDEYVGDFDFGRGNGAGEVIDFSDDSECESDHKEQACDLPTGLSPTFTRSWTSAKYNTSSTRGEGTFLGAIDISSDHNNKEGVYDLSASRQGNHLGLADVPSDRDNGEEYDFPAVSGSGSTRRRTNTGMGAPHRSVDIKGKQASHNNNRNQDTFDITNLYTYKSRNLDSVSLGIGNLVQTEIELRKKESLGMAHIRGGWTLGGGLTPSVKHVDIGEGWICQVCTLCNKTHYQACSACATPHVSRS